MGTSKRKSYGFLRLSLATLALATLASVGAFPEDSSGAAAPSRVQTAFGRVGGERTADGVSVFRGIPYAAPPVGALRWRAPIAPPPWQGVRLATEFSADCLQWSVTVRPNDVLPDEPFPQVSRGRGESEDCLTLNIWTTAPRSNAHLPVMVWIHGGGYQMGSGAISEYDGAAFARAGVVLVTLNYRLGALGFLVHPGLTAESVYHSSGNYGILDQIAALTWIQHNITAFGGDPARVTIFGESAGSGSCNILQASPLAKGLFTRVIGESTSQMDSSLGLLGRQSRRQAEEYGQRYAASLGASSVDELRKLPADALKRSEIKGFWPLGPDGYVLPEGVFETFQHGHQNDAPTLVGYNAGEGVNLRVPWIRPETEEERAAFRHLYGDAENPQVNTDAVAWQMQIWATLQSREGHQPAYLYQFDQLYPAQNGKRAAPEHGSEIIYVFQNFDRVQRAWSAEDRQNGQRISAYWVNFARSGDPNGAGLPHWPEFRAASPQVMRFGPQTRATPAPRQDAYEFIEGYYARRRVSTEGRGADYPGLTNIDLSRNDAALAVSVSGVAALLRISQSSPFITEGLLSNYAVRGDFINNMAADSKVVDAAWTDWRTRSEARVYYGRVPRDSLLVSPH